ncbi:serine O-acetyltransferase [Tumidithrix elongata RA019]|uniref:Serine acetyltransferase n=1 Tax=Tumidithrix elongata BACA0141 TaxID=2716417 RepID=A0AAW9Q8W7_9CYAN|nr:serine O-acetyltransferase [Tumidithrix elongata RA019]
MLEIIFADFQAIQKQDPAAKNWLEIFLCYPGWHALLFHRFAHWLYRLRVPFIPRTISQLARFLTGIEIHPGAQIGKGILIDHGMGVVIGETAIVGNNAIIYQGATLGGTGKETGKRHPTLGENVVVGAGAKVLGNIQIGDRVNIGAGSIVLRDVPAHCTVVGIPGRVIRYQGQPVDSLNREHLPDPEAEVIKSLFHRIQVLEQELLKVQQLQPLQPFQSLPLSKLTESSNGLNGKNIYSHSLTNANSEGSTDSHPVEPFSAKRTSESMSESDVLIQEFLDGAGI